MATPSWPGLRSACPASATISLKRAWGTCVRTPAPSPVRESAPTPPRCVRLTRPARARSTIWREGRPAMSTTRPTPHESCSNAGSQSGAPGSAKRGFSCMMLSLRQVSTLSTRRSLQLAGPATGADTAPHPEPIPDIHSSVDLERTGQFDTTQRPERLDASVLIWATRPTAKCEESLPQLWASQPRPI